MAEVNNAQSSDDEFDSKMAITRKRGNLIYSSDDDDPVDKRNGSVEDTLLTENKESDTVTNTTRKRRVFDSSEEDEGNAGSENERPPDNVNETKNIETAIESLEPTTTPNDSTEKSPKTKATFKSNLLTQSDIESGSESDSERNSAVFKSKLPSDSDSETGDVVADSTAAFKSKLLTKSDIESDSESDREEANENSLEKNADCGYEENEIVSSTKKNKKDNKSMDAKLAIKSETQRMEREMPVNLPYHRPKQRTLREFLSRKKNHLKAENLRLSSSSMIETWMKIDDSIKETADFFKSESEDEDKDYEPAEEICTRISEDPLPQTIENELTNISPQESEKGTNVSPQKSENDCTNIPTETDENNCASVQESEAIVESNMENEISEQQLPDCPVVPEPIVADEVENVEENDRQETAQPDVSLNESLESVEKSLPTEILPMSSKEKTEGWLEEIKEMEKRDALKNRLQLSPSLLNKVPTLSNDPDALIDLDDDVPVSRLKPGARQLMERMFKGRQAKPKAPEVLTTTHTEIGANGEITNVTVETMSLNSTSMFDKAKPGAKFQQFREKLQNEIEAKWEEEYKKRCHSPEKKGFEEDLVSDGEVEEDDLGDADDESSSCGESEPEEEDMVVKEKPRKFCEFGDSEAEESQSEAEMQDEDEQKEDEQDEEEEKEDEQEEESDAEEDNADEGAGDPDCSLPAFQPGGGLLMGGSALTQQTQPLPLPLGISSPISSPAVTGHKYMQTPDLGEKGNERAPSTATTPTAGKSRFLSPLGSGLKKNLFGDGEAIQEDETEDDPFMFVSGAFPETQKVEEKPSTSSQFIPKRICLPDESDESQDVNDAKLPVEDLEAVTNDDDTVETQEVNGSTIIDDDGPTFKKKSKKLAFSDDENEDDAASEGKESEGELDEYENIEEDEEDGAEEAGDLVDGEVDYDSEENEVPVARPKPGEFFENEAELSESEWSGDEDEHGLDRMEAEAGDADVLDEDQVASQLGKIHMKRMHDQDARDVRLLKELLFEDGDLHSDGKGRERKFRWKNSDGFDMAGGVNGEDGGSDGETDEVDPLQAKIRHEKRQFLLNLEKNGQLNVIEEETTQNGDGILKLGRQLINKYGNRLAVAPKLDSVSNTNSAKNKARGSFLDKDAKFLSRLAKAAAGGVSNGPLGPAHSRNFVFAAEEKTTTEEVAVVTEGPGRKRKALGCQETVKRTKLTIAMGNQPSLFDQLS